MSNNQNQDALSDSDFESCKPVNVFQSARSKAASGVSTEVGRLVINTISASPSTSSRTPVRMTSSSSSSNISKKQTFKFTCPICTATFDAATPEFADRHANRCIDSRSADFQESGQSITVSSKQSTLTNIFQSASLSKKRVTQSAVMGKADDLKSITQEKSTLLMQWQFSKKPEVEPSTFKATVSTEKFKSVVKEQSTVKRGPGEEVKPAEIKKKKSCPPHKWIPNTSFTVDAFSYGEIPGCSAYFLSHFHADHYGGLSKKFSYGPLYCSQITANLVELKFKIDPQFVHPLPLNEPINIQGVEVQCIEANHCPGAVMFIFKTNNKTYLHTGDFRATPHILNNVLPHHPFDCVFLDTTYLNPSYKFPPQASIVKLFGEMTTRVANNLPIVLSSSNGKPNKPLWPTLTPLSQISDDPYLPSPLTVHPALHTRKVFASPVKHLLIVVGTYTIGKEKLVFEFCNRLGSLIHCSKEKYAVFKCCFKDHIYTPDPLRAQVHMLPMFHLSKDVLSSYLDRFDGWFSHLLAFKPTGWTSDVSRPIRYLSDIQPTLLSENIALVQVPYSEHSSFEELRRFILGLQIHHIVPTVPTKHPHFLDEWQVEKRTNGGPQTWTDEDLAIGSPHH